MNKQKYNNNIEKLRLWAKEYDNGTPMVDDSTYDALYHKVKEYEKNKKLKNPKSPTQTIVESTNSLFPKQKHIKPMMSLDNLFTEDDITKFVKDVTVVGMANGIVDIDFLIEPKDDGLSLDCLYTDGKIVSIVTRGQNGVIGDNVISNIGLISDLPLTISYEEVIEIRGELTINKDEFEKYNKHRMENGDDPVKTARGAVAGLIRKLDAVKEYPDVKLEFHAWGLGANDLDLNTMEEVYEFLQLNGFKTPDYVRASKAIDVSKACHMFERERNEKEYVIDGAVIKLNQRNLYEKLGYTSKAPKYWKAFKFEQPSKITKIKDIVYNAGRLGDITPVAILEPVVMYDGSTVSRASLANYDIMLELYLHKDDEITLIKTGDIIPQITGNIGGGKEAFVFPDTCPECGSKLVDHKCNNPHCGAKLQKRLENIIGKDCLDIKGFGPKSIENMIEFGFITDTIDIFKLSGKLEDLLKLPRFGVKTRDKIINQIEHLYGNITPSQFIYMMQIPGIGKRNSKLIPEIFDRFIIDDFGLLTSQDLEDIEGIGPVVSLAWDTYMEKNRKEVFELIEFINPIDPIDYFKKEKEKNNKKDIGGVPYLFSITGRCPIKKDEFATKIEADFGWEYHKSVIKAVEILVVGTGTSKGDKLLESGAEFIGTKDDLNILVENGKNRKERSTIKKYVIPADLLV